MIERVAIEGFKAIGRRLELELAPLTVLVGPNGSGKSSVLEAIAVLAQSARTASRIGFVTRGRLVDLGEDFDRVRNAGTTGWTRLEVSWRRVVPAMATVTAWLAARRGPLNEYDFGQGLSETGGMGVEYQAIWNTSNEGRLQVPSGEVVTFSPSASIDRFLEPRLFMTSQDGKVAGELAALRPAADLLAAFLSGDSLRHVGALRGGELMEFAADGSSATSGRTGQNTLRLLSRLQPLASSATDETLARWSDRFGLKRLKTGTLGPRLVAKFEDPFGGGRHDLDLAGFGSQQALPALADLVDAPLDSTIMLEEIEHSLHPDWVRLWGQTLAEAVKERAVQILATTHAPDLVLALGLAVRHGILSPEQIAVYELTRDAGGVSAVRRRLDPAGRISDGWIRTFAEAETKLFHELLSDEPADAPGK